MLLLLLVGCASVQPPPGGPEDHAPPEIIAVSIDTNAVNVKAKKIDITFDEVIGERPIGVSATGATASGGPTLESVVLISPRTGGAEVSWHRDHITIEPRHPFQPNTAYRVTLLPGIADIRGNVRKSALSLTFSTGPTIPGFSIPGRLFDWETGTLPKNGIVEATANYGKADSVTWTAFTDSLGAFDVGPLGPGTYHLRGFIDTDNNQSLGVVEKWDTTTVTLVASRPTVELLAIQRDTAPPGIQRVEVADSGYVRITLDKPYDPRTALTPAMVVIRSADSTPVAVESVISDRQAQVLRPKPDTVRDTTQRQIPRPRPDTISTRPPPPKPSRPAPERIIVAHLSSGARLVPDGRYVVTVRDLPNLLGHTGVARQEFTVPKPPPPVKPPSAPSNTSELARDPKCTEGRW